MLLNNLFRQQYGVALPGTRLKLLLEGALARNRELEGELAQKTQEARQAQEALQQERNQRFELVQKKRNDILQAPQL